MALTYGNIQKVPPYEAALRAVGVEPVKIAARDGVESLDGFAGLLLSGGTDLDPQLYHQTPDSRTQAPDQPRDILELRLLREALERDIPVLAICRGMQLFNVAHDGGTLWQHITGHEVRPEDPSLAAHTVLVQPGSLLATITGQAEVAVNSRHHQAVSQVGAQLAATAQAPEGIVEALERPDLRFAVAVQWHPEDQLRFAPQRRLFEAFAQACVPLGIVTEPRPRGSGTRCVTTPALTPPESDAAGSPGSESSRT